MTLNKGVSLLTIGFLLAVTASVRAQGTLYIANYGGESIDAADSSGNLTTLVPDSSLPAFLAGDSSGNIYVTGFTSSKKFFPTNGMFTDMRVSTNSSGKKVEDKSPYNAFVAVLTSDLSSFVSTNSVMIGGANNDRAHGIIVDSSDPLNVAAHIVGSTTSRNFPKVNPTQSKLGGDSDANDAFVSRLQWP